MNLSPRCVGLFGNAGIEAAHWSALGAHNAPDSEIMAYARLHDYVVLTILTATRGGKPSVVQIRAEDVSPDVLGTRVVAALRQMASELEEDALLTIDANRARIRLLPLQPRG